LASPGTVKPAINSYTPAILKKAAFTQDGVITAAELGAYLRPRVSDASGNTQTPLFGRLGGAGVFLFLLRVRPIEKFCLAGN
jgi:hypothetical protein